MIVNLTARKGDRHQLKILFFKTPPEKRRRKHGRELIDTTCRIFVGESVLATAVAKQSILDKYNKIVGKKIALTRAIDAIFYLRSRYDQESQGDSSVKWGEEEELRRGMRQQIWAEFHKTFGRWR